ncbi:MAG TPA: ABC transporter permease [Verrucomicrobiales bacterium]|nr:ABC transporter permease [Verrucomicrobiales bacterium]
MRAYILRRLLLVPLTLLGITLIVFSITRFLPGGPLEQAIQQATMAEGRGSRSAASGASTLSKEQLEQMRMSFGMNENIARGYLMWLGLMKREYNPRFVDLETEKDRTLVLLNTTDSSGKAASLKAWIKGRDGKPLTLELEDGRAPDGWDVRYGRNMPTGREDPKVEFKTEDTARAVVFQRKWSGLLQGDLQDSLIYGDPVAQVIRERLPVSIFYGLITTLLTYCISIPLGILKAIRHRTWVDNWSSVLLFVGYSIPGFALGALLLLWFAFQRDWFPISGFVSSNFAELDTFGKVKDLVHHAVLPLICYMIAAFALTTMLMKNSIMDVLASDYIRTAVAKGSSFRHAIIGHAVRNSIIPIAATFGQLLVALVSGSFLIETVFDINGAGLLGFTAATHADYNVTMGILLLSSLMLMLGNIVADILLALINPRIRFE